MKPKPYYLKHNPLFPNSVLPVLHYKKAITLPFLFKAHGVKKILRKNGWSNNWKAGIFTFHHYHSNTHEAMAVIKGHTTIILGGENGQSITLQEGDVLVIPAGVAHKNLGKENDIVCIGGYPAGVQYDMNYGKPDERPAADNEIMKVAIPMSDPVTGTTNPLHELWKR